jgi:hypothetical protein
MILLRSQIRQPYVEYCLVCHLAFASILGKLALRCKFRKEVALVAVAYLGYASRLLLSTYKNVKKIAKLHIAYQCEV